MTSSVLSAIESELREKEALASEASRAMPLFFKTPAAIDSVRHASCAIRAVQDYSFARETNSIPLNVFEFVETAKTYPIVFNAEGTQSPLAIVGLDQKNYYVDGHGKWQSDCYIPAYVRQYPFVLFEDDSRERYVLCVDEAAPHFTTQLSDDSRALFEKDGSPAQLSKQALDFCSAYAQHHAITHNFVADLKKHNLLAPYHSEAQLNSGKKLTLSGFLMIEEARVNLISDEVFLDFRNKGWLPFIYLALASASNWQRLVSLARE